MMSLRKFSYVAFAVACTHLVFGAIVRISGSGMGCGDHWPRCYGSFFPPLNRPDLIIEVTHRYLAAILLLTLIGLFVTAWTRRSEPGVGGRRGILRASGLAVALGFSAAILGAVTVKLGNLPFATLAHWTVAMSLVATVVATVIRAGGLGGETVRDVVVSARARRSSFAAAGLALLTVVMGGLTAKYPGAAVACPSFPLCGTNPDVQGAAVHVQLTHRVLAVVLVFHLFGLVMAFRKRGEPAIIRRAVLVAFSFGVLQLLVAGAMIGMHLPPILRSLHEATGVSIWIATFALAYLARIASDGHGVREPNPSREPIDLVDAGVVRTGGPAQVFSTAVLDAPRKGFVEPKEPWQERASAVEAPELLFDAPDAQWESEDGSVVVAEPVVADEVAVAEAPVAEVAVAEVAVAEVAVAEAAVAEVAVAEVPAAEAPVVVLEVNASEPMVPLAPARPVPHSIAVIIARGADL